MTGHNGGPPLDDAPILGEYGKIFELEAELKSMPQVNIPIKHYYGPGVYAREIFIPKGSLVTGKLHKYAQLNIMSKGDISVLLEDGVIRVQAPFTVVSPAGTKRVAYAHEDTVWTTILATTETDPDVIEREFTASTYEEYLEFNNAQAIGVSKCLL